MHREAAVASIPRRNQAEPAALVVVRKGSLLVSRLQPRTLRKQPDLKEVNRFRFRMIELAVPDASARAHALHVAPADHRAGAEAVPVFQRSLQDVRQNLHVAVAVHAETAAGGHAVVVDDAERAVTDLLRVVVVPE